MKKHGKKNKRKASRFEKFFTAFVALLSILTSIATAIYDRKQVVKALQDPETFKTVVVSGKENSKP